MRHLIGIEDLSVSEIEDLIATAEDIIADPAKYSETAKGKKLAALFYEPSTRTRLSFEAAMIELGGSVIGFSDAQNSSAAKGESVADTAQVISCFADIAVMRHFKEGAPLVASLNSSIPVKDSLFIFSLIVLGIFGKVTVGTCYFKSFSNFLTFINFKVIKLQNELFVV